MIEAIKVYRRRVAGASKAEARQFVGQLAAELEAKYPEQIAANRGKLYRVSPTRLMLGLLIEGAALGAILFNLPADTRVPWSLEFLGGWLFSFFTALTATLRARPTKRSRMRLAVLFSGMVATVLLVLTIKSGYGNYERTFPGWGLAVGFVAGIAVVISAIKTVQTRKALPPSAAQ